MITTIVRTFAPDQWGEVDIFRHFYEGTHNFNTDTKKAVQGVANHFEKALTLYQLSLKLLPNLYLDRQELRNKGYTAAANAKEFSAVLEEVFTELYSSIDCTRKIIVAIYKQTRGLPDSTRKLFRKAQANQLDHNFPNELTRVIAESNWYEELLAIRDELTHSDIGNCSFDEKTETVTYMHTGIRQQGNPLIIEDVMRKIQYLIESINNFLGKTFHFLNAQLKPTTISQLCGIFFGRAYLRKLSFELPITLNSGICISHTWFDNTPGFKCPLSSTCGAYLKKDKTHEP